MVSFTSLLSICSTAMTVMAMPRLSNITSENGLVRRVTATTSATISTSTTGTLNGYYYSLWMQANTGATMNVEAGSYSLSWSTSSVNVVGGIGWMPGSARVINYSGTFNSPGNGYLSVYGWTTNPLVEYYIVESYGSYNPATGLASLGTVTSDGGTYNIYHNVRVNAPSIQGTTTFDQYLSVRTSKRVGGTVTTGNHFNAWASHGLVLGTHNEQILATEGYESSGSSSISISQGAGGSTTSPGSGSGTAAHWGQCGGTGWTGPTTCAAPYTCQAINGYYSQCL